MESAPVSEEQIGTLRQEHIGRLLQQAYRAFSQEAIRKLRARGHSGLTLAHSALLSNLDLDGTRITALAERAGMTKQSMGQLVVDLGQRGYIERQIDPLDRRATLIRFTALGWQFLRDAYEIKQEIEAEYQVMLGADGLQHLRTALHQLQAPTEAGAGLEELPVES